MRTKPLEIDEPSRPFRHRISAPKRGPSVYPFMGFDESRFQNFGLLGKA
jgi:hypothetical protein